MISKEGNVSSCAEELPRRLCVIMKSAIKATAMVAMTVANIDGLVS